MSIKGILWKNNSRTTRKTKVIKQKKKPCKECGTVNYIFSKGRCKNCSQKAYAAKQMEKARQSIEAGARHLPKDGTKMLKKTKPIKRSPLKHKRKATGEMEVFKEIWAEREHICQVTGIRLTEDTVHFSHLLPKGKYPKLRLVKENIWIVLWTIHHEWETGDRSKSMFDAKRAEVERLKQKYDER